MSASQNPGHFGGRMCQAECLGKLEKIVAQEASKGLSWQTWGEGGEALLSGGSV